MTTAQDQQSRTEFEAAIVTRMKESGFLEVEIRVECLARAGDSYQDPQIAFGWAMWQAARALPAGMEPVAWVDLQEWPPIRWPSGTTRADYYPIDGAALYTAAQVLAPAAPLTDERIREIDDETHFHEAPDWPVRFARAIEAEFGKASAP